MEGHAVLLNIAAGIALLLWGTRMVRRGVMRAFGPGLRKGLATASRHTSVAAIAGVGTATLLQSSIATALLVASFASRELIPTASALAVMLGADVGSTLAVQALSFDLSSVTPLLLIGGTAVFMASSSGMLRQIGRIAIGLGLMLLALKLVIDAGSAIRSSPLLNLALATLESDLMLAMVLAAALTWMMHSSVAMVLLVMSLASTGAVGAPVALAIVLGANIGSALVPAMISLSDAPAGRRFAFGNLAFRTCGALLVIPCIPYVLHYSPAIGEGGRLVANFHTAFNVLLALACLPLVRVVARAMERLIPDTPATEDASTPRYLHPEEEVGASEAIARAMRETLRMADIVESMLRDVIKVFAHDDDRLRKDITRREEALDRLHEAIGRYLGGIERAGESPEDSPRVAQLIAFATNLEHVGDIIDLNLLELAQKKMHRQLSLSVAGWRELESMHASVLTQVGMAVTVLVSNDLCTARQLLREKERLRALEVAACDRHLQCLREGRLVDIESSSLSLDVLRDLKRIAGHLARVAHPILEDAGELRASRLASVTRLATEAEEHPAARAAEISCPPLSARAVGSVAEIPASARADRSRTRA
jgi:phosphate:Na+ symporter